VAATGAEVIGMASLEEAPERAEIGHLWVLPKAQGCRDLGEWARARGAREASSSRKQNARR
jgi:hypothetical protein